MPENHQGTLRTEVEGLSRQVNRNTNAIWGNGDDGLRGDLIKLRQVVKIATFFAGIMSVAMCGDFATRFIGVQPSDVKATVEMSHKRELQEIKKAIAEIRK